MRHTSSTTRPRVTCRTAVKLILILATAAAIVLLTGCENPTLESGTAPSLSQVNLYTYNSSTGQVEATFAFSVGDTVRIEFVVNDPDLDVTSFTVVTTHVESGNSDTITIPADTQTSANAVYSTTSSIIGPTGTWRAEFTATDAAGNTSAPYTRTYTVN